MQECYLCDNFWTNYLHNNTIRAQLTIYRFYDNLLSMFSLRNLCNCSPKLKHFALQRSSVQLCTQVLRTTAHKGLSKTVHQGPPYNSAKRCTTVRQGNPYNSAQRSQWNSAQRTSVQQCTLVLHTTVHKVPPYNSAQRSSIQQCTLVLHTTVHTGPQYNSAHWSSVQQCT